MIKIVDEMVVFKEVPDEITYAVGISNCQNRCLGCHSPYLREDKGKELTKEYVDNELLKRMDGCTCFAFMGEGNDKETLFEMNKYIKEKFGICTAIYSGRETVEKEYYDQFDYVKIGPYIKEKGPLNNRNTNQRMFFHGKDITEKFLEND